MLEAHELDFENHTPSFKDLGAELFPDRRKKIMVIDDDQDFRLSICEILVDEGFSVMTAKDGEAALNNLIHHHDLPDLILVDLMMPIKNGMEFRREQLQLDEIANIPVVFITGQGYVDGERCILKPVDVPEFIDKIKRSIV